MHPYLVSFDLPFGSEPFHLRSFGVMVALGFLLGAHLYQRIAAKYGDDPAEDPLRYSRITLWILIGVFAGARALYVIVEILRGSDTGHAYLSRPWLMLFFWEGGLVMFGGLIGACLLGTWSARREGVRPMHALDLGLTVGFVGQAVGRIGCLLVGDDFGARVPEHLRSLPFPLTIHVPDPLPPGSLFGAENAAQVLWATQIWMSLNALLLAFIAWRILRGRRYTGQVTLWLLFLYCVTRFVIEGFRGDTIRGVWFGGALSTSQLIALVAGLVLAALLFRFRRRVDPPREAPPRPGTAGAAPSKTVRASAGRDR